MKYAVIADIHGNMVALQHVIKDAEKNGAEVFIFLGDYCVSAPWPKEVINTIRSRKHSIAVAGNGEAYMELPEGKDGQFEISRWAKQQLDAEELDWIAHLPQQLKLRDGMHEIYISHKSETFIGSVEFDHFGPGQFARKWRESPVSHQKNLDKIHGILEENEMFWENLKQLPEGIYLFGHSHVQWQKEAKGRLFINPGSAGDPLDCEAFGAPYTLLTVNADEVIVQEHRVAYDREELIARVKESDQYVQARVWSELAFENWRHCRDHSGLFLEFTEDYAMKNGDMERPFSKETWEKAYQEWSRQPA